jgi:MFS family permease
MFSNSGWRDFIAVTSSVAVLGLGLGSTVPLTALALSSQGQSEATIGWMMAVSAIGGIIGTLAAPRLTLGLGRRKVMLACVWLAAASVVPLQMTVSIPVWAVLRFIFGLSMAPLFVLGEAWINALPGDSVRGRVVAIYTTSFTLCQVAGPLLTQVLTHDPAHMFIVSGAIFLLGIPGIALAADHPCGGANAALLKDVSAKETHATWIGIVRTAPAIIVGAALFAAFDSLMLSFLPLTAIQSGFSQAMALIAVSVTFAGDAGLQILAGILADRFGRWRIQMLCAIGLCVLLPLMSLFLRLPGVWAVYLFLLGGLAGAVYTLSLVASGERFSGLALVRSSGLIALTWNVAATGAPLATGIGSRWFGSSSMAFVLWVIATTFLVTLFKSEPSSLTDRASWPTLRRLLALFRSPPQPGAD